MPAGYPSVKDRPRYVYVSGKSQRIPNPLLTCSMYAEQILGVDGVTVRAAFDIDCPEELLDRAFAPGEDATAFVGLVLSGMSDDLFVKAIGNVHSDQPTLGMGLTTTLCPLYSCQFLSKAWSTDVWTDISNHHLLGAPQYFLPPFRWQVA